MSIRKSLVAVGVCVGGIGLVLATSAASASIPESNTFTGCYAQKSGALRVIDATTSSCLKGETQISWSQSGPQGPTGAPGAQGPVGPAGPQGPAGPSQQIVSVTVYQDTTLPAGRGYVTATCPTGSVLTGGGFAADPSVAPVIYSGPDAATTGWSVGADAQQDGAFVRAYAMCASLH